MLVLLVGAGYGAYYGYETYLVSSDDGSDDDGCAYKNKHKCDDDTASAAADDTASTTTDDAAATTTDDAAAVATDDGSSSYVATDDAAVGPTDGSTDPTGSDDGKRGADKAGHGADFLPAGGANTGE